MTDTPTDSGFSGKLILAFGITMFAVGQSLLFIVVAPLARTIGITELQFGVALSIANLALLASPYWGKKSDEIGRKPIFMVGLIGSAFGTLLVAGVLELGLRGAVSATLLLVGICLSRAAYGLTASALYPAATGYMADTTPPHKRAQGMAIIGGANSLGSILGPAIGGGLAFMGYLFPMYAAIVLTIIGAVWAFVRLQEPERHAKPAEASDLKFTDPRLRPFMILFSSFFLIFIGLNVITAFFIEDRFGITDPAAVMRTAGIVLAVMAGVIVVVQLVVLQVLKPSPRTLIRICAPTYTLSLVIIALAPNVPVLLVGYMFMGLAFGTGMPGINGGASLMVERHQQGAAAGYLAAANTVGPVLGPALGTLIYQISPQAPLFCGAALFAVLTVYAFVIDLPVAPKESPASA